MWFSLQPKASYDFIMIFFNVVLKILASYKKKPEKRKKPWDNMATSVLLSPPKTRGKKLLKSLKTRVHSLKGLTTSYGALLQELWFQEWEKWLINATDSRKLGDEEHFRMFKCARYDYSNQNPIPFCYNLFWTARLKKTYKKAAWS